MADCSAKNAMVVGEPLFARYIHIISIMSSSKTKLSIFDSMQYNLKISSLIFGREVQGLYSIFLVTIYAR